MKRVLFITYFWPPSGKASLHWPLYVIKHLPRESWEATVLTVDEDTFSQRDESLLADVDPSMTILRTAANDPFTLYRRFLGKPADALLIASETIATDNTSFRHRLALWIRMNLFVPDARVGWYFSAVGKASQYLRKHHFDAIVSIGPPHSAHLIGKKLSKRFHIPHIPVLIDPWVDIAYYKGFRRSAPTLALDNYFERSVISHAAAVVYVTQSSREEYLKKYPGTLNKSHVLYWGYNEESFEGLQFGNDSGVEIRLLHAGNIFDFQNPISLWRNIADLANSGKKISLTFIGTVSPGIRHSIEEHGLGNITKYRGFLPYCDVLAAMMDATHLLVCASEKRHVPGKLFEYLRTGKKIIAFGDDNPEVSSIIADADAGALFPYAYAGNDIFAEVDRHLPDISNARRFSREVIANDLAEILEANCEFLLPHS
jgi:glycosyltransferase involved in cell wall biosynthesis